MDADECVHDFAAVELIGQLEDAAVSLRGQLKCVRLALVVEQRPVRKTNAPASVILVRIARDELRSPIRGGLLVEDVLPRPHHFVSILAQVHSHTSASYRRVQRAEARNSYRPTVSTRRATFARFVSATERTMGTG